MKRLLSILLVLLASPVLAQNTQVSASLTDANGTQISNCVYNISLVSSTGQDISTSPVFIGGIPFNNYPVTGNCNAAGYFSVPVLSNTSFTAPASPNPTGTQYNFSIQSQASPPNVCPQRSFNGIFTVTGTTLNLSTALSALAPVVTCGGPSGGVISVNGEQGILTITVGSGLGISSVGRNINIFLTVPFAIDSFVCTQCGTVELGQTVGPPVSGTASYSTLPASANVSDGTNVDTLTTPFTSWSLAHSYTCASTPGTLVTFTLSATLGTTLTATQSISCAPRIFSGTGTSGGATGATASGTSAVLVGDTGTLPSFQLGAETVGTTFNFTLSGNYFYMLLIGAGHTFNVNGFPATLASIPVSFVNEYGVTVSMNLYVGPTYGTGVYSVVVTG
jgi:hypothetical protein